MTRDTILRKRSVAPRSGKTVEAAFKTGLGTAFPVPGPDSGAGGLMELATRGIATPFETYAHQPVAVTGQIILDAAGQPDPAKSDFT